VEQQIVEHVNNDQAKLTRSGKKSYHTVSKIVGVTPQGKAILFGQTNYPFHDLTLTKLPDVLDVLQRLRCDETIGGDPAFQGLQEFVAAHVCSSIKKQPGESLNVHEKQFKNSWKTIRTVVENYFSQIKDFKILKYPFRMKGDISRIHACHHQVFLICAYLLDVFLFPEGTKKY